MTPRTLSLTLLLCLAALIAAPAHAALPGMKVIKLTTRTTGTLTTREFGAAVAISDTYAVVGEPAYDPASPKSGAVHVFNATTGAFIRTLKPTDSTNNDGFGFSLAIQGKYLLVGANRRMTLGLGAAYLFDLSTGKQLRKIDPFEQMDFFGHAVAISGDLLFVSAPEAFNRRGKVLIQGLFDPTITGVIKDDAAPSTAYLGTGLYAYGNQVVVSAPGIGQIYTFNRTTQKSSHSPFGVSSNTPIANVIVGSGHTILFSCPLNDANHSDGGTIHGLTFANTTSTVRPVDPAPAANRKLGRLMAMDNATLVASVESGAAGTSLLVHDLSASSTLLVINPQDLATNVPHSALALSGNRLLIGASGDDMLATDAGVAYLIQPLPLAGGFVTIAARNDPAPGFPGILHNSLGDAAMSFQGLAVTRSTLTGTGSNGGKDIGMYSEVGHPGYLDSVVKSRQLYSGTTLFGSPGSPISNDSAYSIFPSALTGPGITSANNAALFADSTSGVTTVVRKGIPLFGFSTFTVANLRQAAQSATANRVAVRLDAKIGTTGALPENDSAIAMFSHVGVTTDLVREGDNFEMGLKFGQIAPRVALHSDACYFNAPLIDPVNPTDKMSGVFKKLPSGALTMELMNGGTPPGAPDFRYVSFLGEGGSSANMCVRASIKGSTITSANNEMILFNNGSGLSTPFQKGGSIINRIIRVWPLGNRLLAHVTLKGSGFNASNNEALYLYQENGSFSRILQKGYLLPGTNGARVGTFQRVEASARTGHYALLVSLTGSPASTNQMLLRGNVDSGSPSDVDTFSLRAPVPALRKGQLIANGYAGTTRLTSLAFPNNATVDTTSIGRKGLASVVSATGTVLLRATLSDGTTRLIRVP
jgi:hypothetical protein